jgi:hypothetical protein
MNTSRRIFRGRGGATDRRLPKHNARRRQAPPGASRADGGGGGRVVESEPMEIIHTGTGTLQYDSPSDDDYGIIHIDTPYYGDADNEDDSISQDDKDEIDRGAVVVPQNTTQNEGSADPVPFVLQVDDDPSHQEIQHLQRRIKNIRESMLLSANGISNPTTYRNNVLNAVANCLNEWRSIVKHYKSLDPTMKKDTASLVFGMIQHSLQCGPLEGAKPGYFKRCGSEVAKVVAEFLKEMFEKEDAVRALGFTDKQVEAIDTWKKHAQKATEADKPPSKSALKKQQGKEKPKK